MDVEFGPRILLLQGRHYVIAPGHDANRQLGLHLGRRGPADIRLYVRLIVYTLCYRVIIPIIIIVRMS